MASSHPPKKVEPPQPKTPEAEVRQRGTREPAPVCDYEGSAYRTDFWTHDRSYEDAVERIALKAMLPSSGRRLVEIGAGYGRLVDLYADYDEVILFDYSRSLLREAQSQWGKAAPSGRPRYIYVAGDFNRLPFVAGLFDTVTMVRVIHHAPDAPHVLQGIGEVAAPGGTFVLEFANKRNLKSIARWLLRRQTWNPFEHPPYEFVDLNFDFHPQWIRDQLGQAGFAIQAQRTVSHFRLGVLKRLVPTRYLVDLDKAIQTTGRWWQLTPSIFIQSQVSEKKPAADKDAFFRCPACRSATLIEESDAIICQNCGRAWANHDGLHDFKEPV
jgi:ubiquinone/menaquinone biosynthesis C-methylase UbiE